MARKVGQIIARGDRRWLIRVYLGRDHETKKRNYHTRYDQHDVRLDASGASFKCAIPRFAFYGCRQFGS